MSEPENDKPHSTEDRVNARKSAETTAGVAALCLPRGRVGGRRRGVAACAISLMGAVVGYFQLKSR
ncbi:MAG TPA: hypothetical protein VGJ05_03865 [Fimbriiglobus sp.]|jgi:hypothetical protein